METDNGPVSYYTTVLITVAVGGAFLLLKYILNILRGVQRNDEETVENVNKVPNKNIPQQQHQGTKKKTTVKIIKNDKHATDKWLKTTLKGHTGQICDMNFSSNGKYLASCADEEVYEERGAEGDGSDNSSDYCKDTGSSSTDSPSIKPLTRRQRRNRRREEGDCKEKLRRRKRSPAKVVEVSAFYEKLGGISDQEIARFLRSYVLSVEQMVTLGYPMDSVTEPGKVIIFKTEHANKRREAHKTSFDVNAKEFYPPGYKRIEESSDSGNSSESGLDSTTYYSRTKSFRCLSAFDVQNEEERVFRRSEVILRRVELKRKICVRCGDDFNYDKQTTCTYHWGKLTMGYGPPGIGFGYACCGGIESSNGCTRNKLHVWSGLKPGINGPFDDFVKTKRRKSGSSNVYALDCEMLYTRNGLELAKVSAVGLQGRIAYETFVRPEGDIICYNTRFSGITERDLSGKNVKTLKQVQRDLLNLVGAETLLIGHGLENDLRALRILHPTVVDTAVAFPHYRGLPFRRSLKQLVSCLLKREIQNSLSGHDSLEDARACMDLMLLKVQQDFGCILGHSHEFLAKSGE